MTTVLPNVLLIRIIKLGLYGVRSFFYFIHSIFGFITECSRPYTPLNNTILFLVALVLLQNVHDHTHP
jgi:hypothetical protein